MADHSKEKLRLQLSQFIILLAVLVSNHRLLYTTIAVAPMPPAVEKTRGEKELCTNSLIVSSPLLTLPSSGATVVVLGSDLRSPGLCMKEMYLIAG